MKEATRGADRNVVYDFRDEIQAVIPETYLVGDAVQARRALDATREAYDAAMKI